MSCVNQERAGKTADQQLRIRVDRALRASGRQPLRNIGIEASDGCVCLRGCVPSYYLKQLAQQQIMSIEGVRTVENELVVC